MKSIAKNTTRGSATGRPIMVLLDLLGRRMTLRIIWELSQSGDPLTFRDLQTAADTNPSVLNSRLKELRSAGLVALQQDGYALTKLGVSLQAKFHPLNEWSKRWASELEKSSG